MDTALQWIDIRNTVQFDMCEVHLIRYSCWTWKQNERDMTVSRHVAVYLII
jgi:hypothetical protein